MVRCAAVDLGQTPQPVARNTPACASRSFNQGIAMYNHIFVPVEGGSTSERALDEAVKRATLTGARLRLMLPVS